jgi:hypothetical protein
VVADDTLGGYLVLFGGSGPHGALGDTWLWNGGTWTAVRPGGAPPPRAGAAAAFDTASRQLVLFGGLGAGGVGLGDTVILGEQAPVTLGPGQATSSTGSTGSTGSSEAAPTTGAAPRSSSPHDLRRGDLVSVSGTGFNPGTRVTITFHSAGVVVGRATTDRQGHFSATVAVPGSASTGAHHFEASGTGPNGPLAELIAAVDVVGPSGDRASATDFQRVVLTGIALMIPLGTWLALVAAGWWRRRRQPRDLGRHSE